MSKRPSALGQRSEQSETQYASPPSLLIAESRADRATCGRGDVHRRAYSGTQAPGPPSAPGIGRIPAPQARRQRTPRR